MTVFLIISFAVVIALTKAKSTALSSLPDFSLCAKEIPALFLGGYSNVTSGLSFVTPGAFECSTCTTDCTNIWSSSEYAVYSYSDSALHAAANYSFSACYTAVCPSITSRSQCPCLNPFGSTVCSTLACSVPTAGHTCQTFETSAVAGCYCYDKLESTAASSGWLTGILALFSDTVCSSFAASLGLELFLQMLLSVSTLAVNVLLTMVTYALTLFEYNDSSDTEASQLITKVFVSSFVNTAILLLLVYGHLNGDSGLAEAVRACGIMSGDYKDFTVGWYAAVGVQLTLTSLLAMISPHIYPLTLYFIISPIQQRLAKRAEAKGTSTFVMQADLDQIFVGPRFDITERYPLILNMIFFSFMYSSGLPMMLVFALGAFCLSYVVDRFMLLRFYKRPPQRDERLQRKVTQVLPYALLLHLSIAIWMLGNSDILGTGSFNPALAASVSENTSGALTSNQSIDEKIARNNTFPLFMFWVFLVAYLVAIDVLPSHYLTSALVSIKKLIQQLTKVNFKENSAIADNGFTKIYEKPVPVNFSGDELSTGRYAGWELYTYDDGSAVLRKLRSPTSKQGGGADPSVLTPTAAPGAPYTPSRAACRRTWEVIRVNALPSYALSRNPKYREAVMTWLKQFSHDAKS